MMRLRVMSILICLALLLVMNIHAQSQSYSWNDPKISSGELYNQTVTIEGKVASVYNFVRACFVYFGDPNQDFMAVIYYSSFGEFDYKINDYFTGKTVRITGVLEESKGQPIIVLKTKSQVEVLEENLEEKKEDANATIGLK